MFGNPHQYQKLRKRTENWPRRNVTEMEMLELLIGAGLERTEAEMQVRVCKGLGSHLMIGEEMIGLKEDDIAEDGKDE